MFCFVFFPHDLFHLECALAAFGWLFGSRGRHSKCGRGKQRKGIERERKRTEERERERDAHLLVFQMCMVSSSTLSCLRACSSRKSKKYFTAGGTTAPEQRTLRKKLSTNCCSVPWNTHMPSFHLTDPSAGKYINNKK